MIGTDMLQALQLGSVGASLISCVFWSIGAGIRIRPLSLFRLSGPESIPAVLQRQSLMNAFAALFAALAAAGQAAILYLERI